MVREHDIRLTKDEFESFMLTRALSDELKRYGQLHPVTRKQAIRALEGIILILKCEESGSDPNQNLGPYGT